VLGHYTTAWRRKRRIKSWGRRDGMKRSKEKIKKNEREDEEMI
jgi:hypothetical protein